MGRMGLRALIGTAALCLIGSFLTAVVGGQINTGNSPSVLSANPSTFNNQADATNTVAIQAGKTAAQTTQLQYNNYAGTAEWQLKMDTSYAMHLYDTVNSLDRLIIYQGAGNTNLNSGNGSTAVTVNATGTTAGTGGFIVYNGGATPTAKFTVTGSGNVTAAGFIQGTVIGSTGTVSVSGCSLSAAVGGKSVGQFTSGTAGTCTVTITPGITATNGFYCKANDLTTTTDTLVQTASTTTTCTISGTTASGDVINFEALSY